MPPKPFNPPRPSSTSASTSAASSSKITKSKPKPKAAKPTFSAPAKSKSKKSKVDKGKGKEVTKSNEGGFGSASALTGGGRYHLPSLSPDSDAMVEEEDQEEEEEVGSLSGLSDDMEIVSKFKSHSKGRRGSVQSGGDEDEDEDEERENKESIPLPLLQVLLQTHFTAINENKPNNEGGKTRITAEAIEAVGKYVDTFVREAIARAAFDASGGDDGEGERGGGGTGGVLEVESLERICPQLLLDF